jgi:hypothetical protein
MNMDKITSHGDGLCVPIEKYRALMEALTHCLDAATIEDARDFASAALDDSTAKHQRFWGNEI